MKYLVIDVNISEATRRALQKYPHIEEYFQMGIVNYRALARVILDDVKHSLGKEAKLQSVVTAVRRFPKTKAKAGRDRVADVLAGSDVNLKYDVSVVTTGLDRESHRRVEALHSRIAGEEAVQVIQGPQTLTIVTERRFLDTAKKIFLGRILESREDLASIIVTSPSAIVETSGVIAHLASILALEKINVVEMMSSHTETLFIVEEKDALKAVEVIREEIKRARGKA
ncbi:MAG: ACT domain-containing protein [Candidatus Hydrothermarchaeales archaeon]